MKKHPHINKYKVCCICRWSDQCCDGCKDMCTCGEFDPLDENEYCENLMTYLRERNIPTSEQRLKRVILKHRQLYDDFLPTTDTYYVKMINSALNDLRRGDITYLYYDYQVAEVLRFLPEINVEMKDGVFYVRL